MKVIFASTLTLFSRAQININKQMEERALSRRETGILCTEWLSS